MPLTPVKPKTNAQQENKAQKKSKEQLPSFENSFNLAAYFKGVKQEWAKVTWPSRPQVVAETGVVLLVVSVFTLFVFVIDKIFQWIIQWIT